MKHKNNGIPPLLNKSHEHDMINLQVPVRLIYVIFVIINRDLKNQFNSHLTMISF